MVEKQIKTPYHLARIKFVLPRGEYLFVRLFPQRPHNFRRYSQSNLMPTQETPPSNKQQAVEIVPVRPPGEVHYSICRILF